MPHVYQSNTSKQILAPALKFKARLFSAVPDVTQAESLGKHTFHGNEVRVMVHPGDKKVCLEHKEGNTLEILTWQRRAKSVCGAQKHFLLKQYVVEEKKMWCFILSKDTWFLPKTYEQTLARRD